MSTRTDEDVSGRGRSEVAAVLQSAYPRAVASLVRILGSIDRAEDAAQDASIKALARWPESGLPDDAVAWLVTVGRNRAFDQLRRDGRSQSLDDWPSAPGGTSGQVPGGRSLLAQGPQDLELGPLEDDLLRLIFTCCHPALQAHVQVLLTLKVVLGFSVEELARCLLLERGAVEKRLTRAKQRLRQAGAPYEVPLPAELASRLDAVLRVIYLVFNEGYSATVGEDSGQVRLCHVAIRLARMVTSLFRHHPETRALLAMMMLSFARRRARVDVATTQEGTELIYVPLDRQDRSLWDAGLIAEGVAIIDGLYAARHPPGPYQLQAAISSIHAVAATSADTDWQQIASLYEKLLVLEDTPVVQINCAVARANAGAVAAGLQQLVALAENAASVVRDYQPYHAALAFVAARAGRAHHARALTAYARAIELTSGEPERRYLAEQRASLTPE